MSDNGDIREDLRVPESEVGKEIESKFEAGDEFMVRVEILFVTLKKLFIMRTSLAISSSPSWKRFESCFRSLTPKSERCQ